MNNNLNIFISSPSDVIEEREIIRKTVQSLNMAYKGTDFPYFNIIELKQDIRSDIGSGFGPQEIIDKQIDNKYDIFIGILWKRYGTSTENYGSGTEQEFENALKSGSKVMFYFSNVPVSPEEIIPEEFEKILKFKEKISDKGLYYEYNSMLDFEKLVYNNLRILAIEKRDSKNETPTSQSEEEKGIFDHMDDFYSKFDLVQKDMDFITDSFSKMEIESDKLEQPKENDLNSFKIYTNQMADVLDNFSKDFTENRKNLSNHFSEGIDSLVKVLELSNDYIDDSEFNTMIDSIRFCINSVDEINSQMDTIITLFDSIPPLTKKFNKSKRNFTRNIKSLSKELKNIKGMLYSLLAELD